jgi:hypothetical protein
MCSAIMRDKSHRWLLGATLIASHGEVIRGTDLRLLGSDEFVRRFEKTLGSSVKNKAKANEDSSGTLVIVCQTTLASHAEFSRDIQ